MRFIFLFLSLFLFSFQSSGQDRTLRLGLDLGVSHYDVQDDILNINKHQGSSFTATPKLYWINEKFIAFGSLGYQSATLTNEIPRSNFLAKMHAISLSYDYLRLITRLKNISIYAGAGVHSLGKVYDRQDPVDSNYILDVSILNLRFTGAVNYHRIWFNGYFILGYGLFNYWNRGIPHRSPARDYELQADLFTDFNQFSFTFFNLLDLKGRWELKPEFSLLFISNEFMDTHSAKNLTQRWLLGLYYKL